MDYITESAFFAYECQKSGEQVELESYINECLILAEGITKSSINNLVSFNEAERKGLFQRIKDVLKKFINAYIQNGYTEKIAKNEVLNYIDYIVHINKSECKADTVYEVTPSKTSAASLKIVSDFS